MLLAITAASSKEPLVLLSVSTGWLKKVSNYQESSLSRIKNRQCGYICHRFRVQNDHKNVI